MNIKAIGIYREESNYKVLKAQHTVSQGWSDTGDLSFLFHTTEELNYYLPHFGFDPVDQKLKNASKQLLKEIKTGDIILACEGQTIKGICEMPEDFIYFYNLKNPNYPNSLFPVHWVDWEIFCKDNKIKTAGGQFGPKGIVNIGDSDIIHYIEDNWDNYKKDNNISVQPKECEEELQRLKAELPEKIKKSKIEYQKRMEPQQPTKEYVQQPSDDCVKFSEKDSIEIFNLKLNIPLYQRIYVWRYVQVKTLLDDICKINNLKKYFIGAIILHIQSGNYDLVDGQQRIVTIALIWHVLFSNYNEEVCHTINEHEKIKEGINNFLKCEYASLEAQQNIANNYEAIKKYLSVKERRDKIIEHLPKVYFSVLTIKNADKLDLAFTFFSNTNSKGKKLTDYDLLKPHHLRYIPTDLEDQQMHLARKWDDMINKERKVQRDINNDNEREYISYIRVMELILFRLRNWNLDQKAYETEEHHLKKEFEAASTISEIPPFGEQFNFGEPIQGGQHFFAYVDHFLDEYNKFGMKDEEGNFGIKQLILECFGKDGSCSWYGTVIEALVFCYYLKFGNSYIYEATMSIVRHISIIRFNKGRAYKPTICEWARTSKIVMEIGKATSPTFVLAAIEKRIDDAREEEEASKGVRNYYLENCCKPITEKLTKKTKVKYYQNYYIDRYGKFSNNTGKNR